jgi:hypothetical protein
MSPNVMEPVANNGLVSQTEFLTVYERPIPEQMYLFERHANYVGFATLLRMMGNADMVQLPTIGHFENPWIHDQLDVGAIVTPPGGAGDNIVVSIDPAAHYDSSATVGGAPREATYPVVGDVIELYDRTQGIIIAKDSSLIPNQVTIRPLKTTGDLTPMAGGQSYSILYNLHAEASGLPAGRAPRVMRYNNTLGLIKHSFGLTGFELTNAVYHELTPGGNNAGQSIEVKIKSDEVKRFEKSKSGLLLHGQTADNIQSTATELGIDVPIESTEGFLDFGLTSGTTDNYTPGSYTITDFDTIANILLDERSAAQNDVMGWLGPNIFTEIENSFTNTLTQNLIYTVDSIVPGYANYMNQQYHQQVTASSQDFTLSFGYSAINKNGFVFHMKRLSEFADIRRAGNSDYPYRAWAYWYPISWTRDMLSGSNRPTVGYQYKGMGSYQRDNLFGELPGAGVGASNSPYGPPVTEFDTIRYFLMSHCGFHGAVGNAIVVQTP